MKIYSKEILFHVESHDVAKVKKVILGIVRIEFIDFCSCEEF